MSVHLTCPLQQVFCLAVIKFLKLFVNPYQLYGVQVFFSHSVVALSLCWPFPLLYRHFLVWCSRYAFLINVLWLNINRCSIWGLTVNYHLPVKSFKSYLLEESKIVFSLFFSNLKWTVCIFWWGRFEDLPRQGLCLTHFSVSHNLSDCGRLIHACL